MKLKSKQWCKIQEALVNMKCPQCFTTKVKLTEDEGKNATCEGCGCQFEFNPEIIDRIDI